MGAGVVFVPFEGRGVERKIGGLLCLDFELILGLRGAQKTIVDDVKGVRNVG